MLKREHIERVTERIVKEQRESGRSVDRESVRKDVVKRAKRYEIKNNK
tara:strand:+ start:3169 stop:3312 length:144 start_codon:yes stop_codon:yes gene_type:complete